MPHKHPVDRQAQARKYYREHAEEIKERSAQWYAEHKDTQEYKDRKAIYMRRFRRKRRDMSV